MSFDYEASFVLGGKYAELVAKRLRSDGIGCYAPPIKLARNNEERDYMTKYETDIVLTKLKDYLEVKSSSRFFTDDLQSYPYNTLFVDTVSGFDAKVFKPLAYVFVSQKGNGILCLSPKTKPSWEVREAYDSVRNITDRFYSVSKEMLQPYSLLVGSLQKLQRRVQGDTDSD